MLGIQRLMSHRWEEARQCKSNSTVTRKPLRQHSSVTWAPRDVLMSCSDVRLNSCTTTLWTTWSGDWLTDQSEVTVRVRLGVFKALQLDALQETLLLRELEECEVDEDVLVRHLDAEGSLRADALDSALHVQRSNVKQTTSKDIHCHKRSCKIPQNNQMQSCILNIMCVNQTQQTSQNVEPVRPMPALQCIAMGGPFLWPVHDAPNACVCCSWQRRTCCMNSRKHSADLGTP